MSQSAILVNYGHGGVISGKYQTPGKRYGFDVPADIALAADAGVCRADAKVFWIYEGVVNRQIAYKLMGILHGRGIPYYNVPQALWNVPRIMERDIGLGERVRRGNVAYHGSGETAIWVGLHSNAIAPTSQGPSQSARGFLVFTSPGQTGSDPIATRCIERLQREFDGELRVRTTYQDGSGDSDPDAEANFYELRRTHGRAILPENLFFDNIHDAIALLTPSIQHRIAICYADALTGV